MRRREILMAEFRLDALHLSFLAPDFLLQRMSFVISSFQPGGHEQRMALMRGMLGTAVIMQIANVIFADDHKIHPEKPFSLVIGNHEYTPRAPRVCAQKSTPVVSRSQAVISA